jgi:hypothetical protein
MNTNTYHFITHWQVKSTLAEVNDVLGNALDLVRWWPSVYLDVKQLAKGEESGVGRVISLYTKGWLPYTLKWQFRVTESHYPNGFAITALGDFVGRGVWTFKQEGENVLITYDWNILAEKPLLKYLSFIMKPIFGANHRWAMQKGYESLQIELQRRHATTSSERQLVPPPPPPTFAWLTPKDEAPSEMLAFIL